MLILFDIDATLITTSRAGITALGLAGQDAFGPQFSIEGVEFAGRLDPLIVDDLLTRNSQPTTAINRQSLRVGYQHHLIRLLAQPGMGRALPGVLPLLQHLRSENRHTLGLLTGNFPETGRIKLRVCGLEPDDFPIQVWGDESPHLPPCRTHLPPIALQRASAHMKRPVSGHNAIVIGDTPHDISCARASGMRCLAVATGMFTVDQLQAAGATRAISDLSETQAVVEYLSQDASDR